MRLKYTYSRLCLKKPITLFVKSNLAQGNKPKGFAAACNTKISLAWMQLGMELLTNETITTFSFAFMCTLLQPFAGGSLLVGLV